MTKKFRGDINLELEFNIKHKIYDPQPQIKIVSCLWRINLQIKHQISQSSNTKEFVK